MKQILILGGGFAGLQTAINLSKKLKGAKDVAVTLIDAENYHVFHASLYEVATSPEELTSLSQLKKTVAFPIKEVLENKKVSFIQGKITKVDAKNQSVYIGERKLAYDFLVLALGAKSNFYGIPGAEENAFTLQNVNDALRIRNRLEFLAQMHRQDITKKNLRVVIAGGGFAGVELAAELKGYLDYLAWENSFPREKLETLIVEGASNLVPGKGQQVVGDVTGRLKELGVRFQTGTMITKVEKDFLEFNNGERLAYDCLIWTAGVQANTLPITPEFQLDKSNKIAVNESLQSLLFPNIFVMGDQACVVTKSGKPVPGTAVQAIDEAKFIPGALLDVLKNRKPAKYVIKDMSYIIPLGGKWMIYKNGPVYITGYLAYLIRQVAFVQYFASLLGWWKAIQLIWLENKIYAKND